MALLDKGLLQRMVGALVLIALAVIFMPMLFNREDNFAHVTVDAPAMPAMPSVTEIEVLPIERPEAEPQPQPQPQPELELAPDEPALATNEASADIPPAEVVQPVESEPRLDERNLPVSWSVQLASLSNRDSAIALQKELRSQGYNAYVRSVGGMNRVMVGPLIERTEASRLRDLLQRQRQLDGFVVRFKPEER